MASLNLQSQPLHSFLVILEEKLPNLPCPMFTKAGSPCKKSMKDNESAPVDMLLGEMSRSLTSNSRVFKHSETLLRFCERCHCQFHRKNSRHTLTQWMDEIEDREAKQRLFDLISSKWPAPTIVLDFETPNSTRKENCHKADLFWDKDEALTLVMKKNLSSEDKKTGYIYVIYFPGSPGKLKVGTSEIHCKDARFKNHQECFPGCDLIYCKSVGNARRVEQIIFTDFEDNRRLMKHPCSNLNCRQKHTEFFEVGKAELFARIDKWREWMDNMNERPYSKGGVFNIKASRSSPHRKSVRESIGGSSPPSTPSKTGKGSPSGSIPTSFFSELEDSGYGSEPEMSGGDSCGSLTSQMEGVKIK